MAATRTRPILVNMADNLLESALDAGIPEAVAACRRIKRAYQLGYFRKGSAAQKACWSTRAADVALVTEMHREVLCQG